MTGNHITVLQKKVTRLPPPHGTAGQKGANMWDTNEKIRITGEYTEALRHMREAGTISGKDWRRYKDQMMNATCRADLERIYREAQHGQAVTR